MAKSRQVEIAEIGQVILKKSRLAKRMILKIDSNGKPQVTLPIYTPYILAETFARQHKDWLKKHINNQPNMVFYDGQKIGQKHTIKLKPSNESHKISCRVAGEIINVKFPSYLAADEGSLQAEIKKACLRAIKAEAQVALPKLLYQLSQKYGYTYKSVSVKNMKTRWGSCSNQKIINLNMWLISLPDELIEYVLCHELAHLNHQHHQKSFWNELANMIPDYARRRKLIKSKQPNFLNDI